MTLRNIEPKNTSFKDTPSFLRLSSTVLNAQTKGYLERSNPCICSSKRSILEAGANPQAIQGRDGVKSECLPVMGMDMLTDSR
jgi:hypothetical protein